MAEYISRDDLLEVIYANVAEKHNERCSQLLEAILNAPTADLVKVVRCKDCKFYSVFHLACIHTWFNGYIGIDGFCSYGVRKGGENNDR